MDEKYYLVTEEIKSSSWKKGHIYKHLNIQSSIDIIVVEHKDRLARLGTNYIEKLLSLDNRKIEVINPQMNEKDDLMQDFVAIITSFCARLYGKRRTKRQTEKLINELNKDKEE